MSQQLLQGRLTEYLSSQLNPEQLVAEVAALNQALPHACCECCCYRRCLWQKHYKHKLAHFIEEEAARRCLDCFSGATLRQGRLFLASYEASIAAILAMANFWDMQMTSLC